MALMYGIFGGCTTLFHLAVKHPVLVLVFTLAGLGSQVQASTTPGDRMGTDAIMSQVEQSVLSTHPELPAQVERLRQEFEKLDVVPTEDQIRQVLSFTDPCTDKSVEEVLSDPGRRREAAWLLYLHTFGREGPEVADQLFLKRSSPPPLR